MSERGFTLVEALVTLLMMLVVFFAVHAVFEAGLRAADSGRDGAEADRRVRLAMDRMEREIRAASLYAPDRTAGRYLFFASYDAPGTPQVPAGSTISFGNDLDGRCGLRVVSGASCTSATEPKEVISYYVNPAGTLVRRSNDSRIPLARGVESLRFSAFDSEGDPATSEAGIRRVEIALEVRVGESEREIKADVAPRSRSG